MVPIYPESHNVFHTTPLAQRVMYRAQLVDARLAAQLRRFLDELNERQDERIVAVIPIDKGRTQIITEYLERG